MHNKVLLRFFFINTVSIVLAYREPFLNHLALKRLPRNNFNDTVRVHIGFYVESIGNFRETEMAFDMDLYLYMSWEDDRLQHNESEYILVNDKHILSQMWLPDLYFANARTAVFHDVTVPNFNMFISPSGTVSYGARVTLTLACNLNLKNYPLDVQTCLVKIISYAYVKSEMHAVWFENEPIRYNPEIGLPEFRISSMKPSYCNGIFHYTLTPNSSRIGDFSCLLGMLHLEREIGYHLVQSYIPTGLIVAISWVSFWIDRRAVPARVSLSFTTLLTLSTQGNGIRYGLPAVSYAKAIDWFYGVCMLFIFGVLLEFAIVNSYMRRAVKFNLMAERMQRHNNGRVIFGGESDEKCVVKRNTLPAEFDSEYEEAANNYYGHSTRNSNHFLLKSVSYSRRALNIDKTSRYAFPLLFVLFNLMYWMYYLEDPSKQYDQI